MKRFLNLFKQDLLLSWRNGLVLVTLITLAIIVALYWTLPLMISGDLELEQGFVLFDDSEGGALRDFLSLRSTDRRFSLAASPGELESRLAEAGGFGVIVSDTPGGGLSYDIVYDSPVSETREAVVLAVLESIHAEATSATFGPEISINELRPGSAPIEINQSLVVIMLALEAMILGFLFVAVVVFQEKQEGSIRAYRVSPGGLLPYVASKVLVFSLMSTAYGLIMVLMTLGFAADYLLLAPVLFLSCLFMTALGLGVAVHFKNISEWFVPGVLILAVNMLSILPYQLPGYSNPAISVLPGYQMIYAMTEILYPSGRSGYLAGTYGYLAVYLAVAALVDLPSVKARMMKEVR
jgi:hypothetical protein